MWYGQPTKAQTSLHAYAQSDQSLCYSLEYSMTVKLLTEQRLEFLSLKGGCTGSPESTLVKMPHCWKPHVAAHISKAVLKCKCLNQDHFNHIWKLLASVELALLNMQKSLM